VRVSLSPRVSGVRVEETGSPRHCFGDESGLRSPSMPLFIFWMPRTVGALPIGPIE